MQRLDQVRSPLSSLLPPVTSALHENDPINPGRTEHRASSDSTNSSESFSPSDESLTGYRGEQKALSAAERLLSRSLAMACAEDGVTLNAELGPNYSLHLEPKC